MLLRFDKNTQNDFEESLSLSGIKDCKRTIHVFVNKFEFNNGVCKTGRAVLINESLIQGDKCFHTFKVKNGNIIKITVYYFDVVFEKSGDINTAILTLTDSFGAERQISYDNIYNKTTILDISQYSSIISGLDEYTKNFIADGDSVAYIPPPKYYNELQMYNSENDYFSILACDTIQYYTGSELIDDKTSVNYYDITFWDTMNPPMRERIEHDQLKGIDGVGDIEKELFIPFSNALLSGGRFTYDSTMGVNIENIIIPYSKYQHKDIMQRELNNIKSDFVKACQVFEKQYGSLRVFMNQGLYGDTYSIHCRDYNKENQPFENEGKNSTSIDKSFATNAAVTEFVYETVRDEE